MSRKPRTSVPTVLLQALFDMAVNSMNFGSGFLDSDDVNHLRATATLLGVDPVKATPYEFQAQYLHPFEGGCEGDESRCRVNYGRCMKPADDRIHGGGSDEHR